MDPCRFRALGDRSRPSLRLIEIPLYMAIDHDRKLILPKGRNVRGLLETQIENKFPRINTLLENVVC